MRCPRNSQPPIVKRSAYLANLASKSYPTAQRSVVAALAGTTDKRPAAPPVQAFTAEILGNSDDPAEGSWREAVRAIRARLNADPLLEPVTVAADERIGIIESACRAL